MPDRKLRTTDVIKERYIPYLRRVKVLNAIFKEMQSRLEGLNEANCIEYFSTIRDFAENAQLVAEIDLYHLDKWLIRLFHRAGRYMIGGVGRSGLVARAFAKKFNNLGRVSYCESDFNLPSLQKGDVYIPISASGNSYEPLEGIMRAFGNGADVMAITAEQYCQDWQLLWRSTIEWKI